MNDNSYTDAVFEPVEPQKPDRRPELPIRDKKRPKNSDLMMSILPILSALILLFAVILTLTVALINADFTPPPPDRPAGMDPADQPIADYMAHPQLPSYATVAESTGFASTGVGVTIPDAFKDAPSRADKVNSKSAVLVELGGMTAVAGREVDKKLQIASMTKVMTLLVCLDYITEAGDDAFYGIISLKYDHTKLHGYNCAFIEQNGNREQRVYVLDALYGLILESGADCAYGLAEHFAGSEKEFVKKMNEKAAALGMSSTTFTNCVGKDDSGKNLSSVRDVATMFAYALKNDLAKAILTAPRWVCVGLYHYQTLTSLVLSTVPKNDRDYGSVTVTGGKSGLEDMAGYCLVTVGRSTDGREFICVTAGSDNAYTDSAAIYRNFVS